MTRILLAVSLAIALASCATAPPIKTYSQLKSDWDKCAENAVVKGEKQCEAERTPPGTCWGASGHGVAIASVNECDAEPPPPEITAEMTIALEEGCTYGEFKDLGLVTTGMFMTFDPKTPFMGKVRQRCTEIFHRQKSSCADYLQKDYINTLAGIGMMAQCNDDFRRSAQPCVDFEALMNPTSPSRDIQEKAYACVRNGDVGGLTPKQVRAMTAASIVYINTLKRFMRRMDLEWKR